MDIYNEAEALPVERVRLKRNENLDISSKTLKEPFAKIAKGSSLTYLTIMTGDCTRFATLWLTLPSTISCNEFNPRLPINTTS